MGSEVKYENCTVVLCDVAGTTTAINFVKEVLFPFVVKQAEPFLKSKWEDSAVKEIVKELAEKDQTLDVAKTVELVKSLTEKESDDKHFKTLQGLIYTEGYDKGDLKAHIFEDVPVAFEKWAKTKKIAIYSTGSVESQKQLFKNTILGDLSKHIANYFDQTVGSKLEAESYKKIAKTLEVEPDKILFLTDNVGEAKAAKAGNLQAVLLKRTGNADLDEEACKEFSTIESFEEISLENVSKRKNEELPSEEPPSKVAKQEDSEKKPEVEKKPEAETKSGAEKKPEAEKKIESEKKPEEPMEVEKPEETKAAETVVETPMETSTECDKTEEKKIEEKTEKTEASSEKADETTPKENKADGTKDAEKAESKSSEEKTEPKPAEEKAQKNLPEEEEKTTEAAPEEVKEAVEEKPAETVPDKEQTKENESVLANGVENGKTEEKPEKSTEEPVEKPAENGETKKEEETEVKSKKLEETVPVETVETVTVEA